MRLPLLSQGRVNLPLLYLLPRFVFHIVVVILEGREFGPRAQTGIITEAARPKIEGRWIKSAYEPDGPPGRSLSRFLYHKQLGIFPLSLGWDTSPSQGGYLQHYISRYPIIHLSGERHWESKVSGSWTKHTDYGGWNPDRSIRSPARQPSGIDAFRAVKGKVRYYSNQKLPKIRFFWGLVYYHGFKLWERRNLTLLLESNRREKLGQRSQCGRHVWLEPDELDWWTPFPVTRNSCLCHLMITSANNLKMNFRHKELGWKLSSRTSCQSLVTIVGFFQLWPKGIKKQMYRN